MSSNSPLEERAKVTISDLFHDGFSEEYAEELATLLDAMQDEQQRVYEEILEQISVLDRSQIRSYIEGQIKELSQ